MSDSRYWGSKLAHAHAERTGSRRGIRLPDPRIIEITGELSSIRMLMKSAGLKANMQTNAAAFEAWALALKVWCNVERVELSWTDQPPKEDPHFQRLLYRIHHFSRLFQWFRLANPEVLKLGRATYENDLVINVRRSVGKLQSDSPEATRERELHASREFAKWFSLAKVGRQFPVGLFSESVLSGNRIFPGGASAIDLIGVDSTGECLSVFELKAGENIVAGAISELLLYCWMLQDAIRGKFQFQSETSADRDGVQPSEVRTCRRIEARLIGDEFHPLFDGGHILAALTAAHASVDIPIRFDAFKLPHGGSPT